MYSKEEHKRYIDMIRDVNEKIGKELDKIKPNPKNILSANGKKIYFDKLTKKIYPQFVKTAQLGRKYKKEKVV